MRIKIQRQVGQMVTLARRSKNLTQGDVAKAAHVSRQLVNRLEMGGATGISLSKLMAILAAVDCSLWIEPDDAGMPGAGAVVPEADDLVSEQPLEQESLVWEVIHRYQLDTTLFETPKDGQP